MTQPRRWRLAKTRLHRSLAKARSQAEAANATNSSWACSKCVANAALIQDLTSALQNKECMFAYVCTGFGTSSGWSWLPFANSPVRDAFQELRTPLQTISSNATGNFAVAPSEVRHAHSAAQRWMAFAEA
eukprot:m.356920 g.356920  ORF g.356920 m.356920 type:complete len:130 (-) comp19934_c0_seq5:1309-1698(-)